MAIPIDNETINAEAVKRLASLFCSAREIAAIFNTSVNSILRNFETELEEGKQIGRSNLKKLAWKRIQEGSDRVLLRFLSHYCGVDEKMDITTRDGSKFTAVEILNDEGETIGEKRLITAAAETND